MRVSKFVGWAAVLWVLPLSITPAAPQAHRPQDDPVNYCVTLFDSQMVEKAFDLLVVERSAVLRTDQLPTCECSLSESSGEDRKVTVTAIVSQIKYDTSAEAQSRLNILKTLLPQPKPVPGYSSALYYVLTEKTRQTVFFWGVRESHFIIAKVSSVFLSNEQLRQSFSFMKSIMERP